jgi:hypothetical protein
MMTLGPVLVTINSEGRPQTDSTTITPSATTTTHKNPNLCAGTGPNRDRPGEPPPPNGEAGACVRPPPPSGPTPLSGD